MANTFSPLDLSARGRQFPMPEPGQFLNQSRNLRESQPAASDSLSDVSSLFDTFEPGLANQWWPSFPPPPGQMSVGSDGTYQLSSSRSSLEFDLSFEQSIMEVRTGENGEMFASLQQLNLSVSVSAEYEEFLVSSGQQRGNGGPAAVGQAAQQAVDRFVASGIQSSISIDLSFSSSSLSINSNGDMLSDLSTAGLDDSTLGGYATLIEAIFGDDEKMGELLSKLRGFLEGIAGGSGDVVQTEGTEVSEGASDLEARFQSLDVHLELNFESTSIEVEMGKPAPAADPIVLDLDGDGIELTTAVEGVRFDLDADGTQERMATVTGGDGFLALDRNGNGRIDSGRELFGDQNGAINGFEELRKFDDNGDARIDSSDRVYDQLLIFRDDNRDGVSGTGELYTLADIGIASLDLGYRNVNEAAAGGNTIAQTASYSRADGSRGTMVDALLNRVV